MQPYIGVMILNWNKKEYLLNCIRSVLTLNYTNYRLLVVDNGPTDGSVEAVRAEFPAVELLIQPENLGGTGGFNAGMQFFLDNDNCKYIYLLDNDVTLDSSALSELVQAMEVNPEVAIAGSKIMIMDKPNQLQEMGARVDWEAFNIKPLFQGAVDGPDTQSDVFVDYVPACSLLVRVEALKRVGLMDEGFFLYWDDIEWGVRMKNAGYKVMVAARSKVWHKMGVANRSNALPSYYFWRNRLFFFFKYTQGEQQQRFIRKYALEFYQSQFACWLYGKKSTREAIKEALLAGVRGVRGKKNGLSFPTTDDQEPIWKKKLGQVNDIGFIVIEDEALLLNVLYKFCRIFPDIRLTLISNIDMDNKKLQGILPVNEFAQGTGVMANIVLPVQHVLWGDVPRISRDCRKKYWLADNYGNILPLNLRSNILRLVNKLGLIMLCPLITVFMGTLFRRIKRIGED